jgi:hypothetical protein
LSLGRQVPWEQGHACSRAICTEPCKHWHIVVFDTFGSCGLWWLSGWIIASQKNLTPNHLEFTLSNGQRSISSVSRHWDGPVLRPAPSTVASLLLIWLNNNSQRLRSRGSWKKRTFTHIKGEAGQSTLLLRCTE